MHPLPQASVASALSPADLQRFGPNPRESFAANLALVHRRIAVACEQAGRPFDSVRLLPVTKTVPADILRLAWSAGVTDFAENKLQEARDKAEDLADLAIRWHIVGHLQSNKVKYLTRLADEFHALDSLKLADILNRRLEADDRDMNVYVQVNTSGEQSKFGLHPDDAMDFIERLEAFPRLKPQGLMTLAVFSDDPDRVRPCFTLLRRLRDQAQRLHPRMTGLSMGMSGDYELAVREGATVVRVGQAIFGPRPTPNAHYWPGLAE